MKKTAAKKVTRFKKSLSKSNSSTSARKTPRVKAPIVDLAVEIEDTSLPKPEDEMTVQKPEPHPSVQAAIQNLESKDESSVGLTQPEQEMEKSESVVSPNDNAEEQGEVHTVLPKDSFEEKKEAAEEVVKRPSFLSSEAELPKIEKNNRKLFFLGAIVFILTVILTVGVGVFVLQSTQDSQKNEKAKQEEKALTPTAEPTEAKGALTRDEWVFEVLNGSGKSGVAASARTKLEALGYEVDSVGNAKENVSRTQVFVPEASPDTTSLFEDLEKDFGKLTVTGVLEEDSKVTIRIVLGSE